MHPYDDPEVIAGQGTIGMEILRQHTGALDAIFVPVGGGGLISGIAAYVKSLRPSVRVIGVEPVDADAMARSLKARRRVVLDQVGLFADGVAVKRVGRETFRLCAQLLDGVVRVDTDEMCAAIKDVFEDTRVVLEPAGALAIAGAKAWVDKSGARGKTLVAVASRGQHQFRPPALHRRARRRSASSARRSSRSRSRSGPAASRSSARRSARSDITEFNYRIADSREAHIFVGVEVANRAETARIVRNLERHGLHTLDLSDNEMAKLHLRHMVGGRAPWSGTGARCARERAGLPLRVSGAAWRADEVPRQSAQ